MTYEEAEEFKTKHEHVYLQLVEFVEKPFYIRHILIAPKELQDKISLLNENIYKPIDNKTALRNMGLLDKNLDVYIIGSETIGVREEDTLQVMSLYVYLRATNQLN